MCTVSFGKAVAAASCNYQAIVVLDKNAIFKVKQSCFGAL
jgi:hypothetical protein